EPQVAPRRTFQPPAPESLVPEWEPPPPESIVPEWQPQSATEPMSPPAPRRLPMPFQVTPQGLPDEANVEQFARTQGPTPAQIKEQRQRLKEIGTLPPMPT